MSKAINNVRKLDLVHLFITRKCNLNCRHCYTNSSDSLDTILPFSFWKSVIKQLNELQVRRIHIEGGEAFLHPDFDKIIIYIAELGIKNVLLVTNGILATRERLEILRKNGLKRIAISLDSLDRDVHNALRPDSHEYALQAIKNAIDLGFTTRISCCLNRKNIKTARLFVDTVYSMGVRTLNLDWFVSVGRGNMVFDEYGITEADEDILCEFESDIYDIAQNARYRNFNLFLDLPEWYKKRNVFMTNDTKRTRHLACDAIIKQVSINEVGDVYPCFIFAYGDGRIGNLNCDSLIDIINNSGFSCIDCPISATGHFFCQLIF